MTVENIPKEYDANDRGQSSCQYYAVFCTKFNRKVFTGEYADVMKNILSGIGKSCGFSILDMIVGANAIQCIVSCPPDISIQKCINTIKTCASSELYAECPELKTRMPQMWTKKNFISSMGDVTFNSICDYIESQRKEQ